MKNYKSLSMAFTLATASVVGFAPGEVQAQGIQAEVQSGMTALKAGQWEKSRKIFEKLTSGPEAEKNGKQFGDKFGEIYYFQGIAERNAAKTLKKAGKAAEANELFKKAAATFDNCYKLQGPKNRFAKKCLLSKGESLQDMSDFAGAIQAYEKFQKEGGAAAKKNPGALSMKMAISYFKLEEPDFKKGIRLFEAALKNKARWKTQDAAIVQGFQALTEAAIRVNNEQAILDFLSQNRAALTLKPGQMSQFTPFLQKLGSQALKAKMHKAAFNLFALVPDTQIALADLQDAQAKLDQYPLDELSDGGVTYKKAQIEAQSTKLQKLKSSGDPPEVFALTALAFTYEKSGYLRGAFAAYEQLEQFYKKSKSREENLYNLVRLATLIGEEEKAVSYGETFSKRFPASKRGSNVGNLMLSTLFSKGKYKRCEELAERLAGELEKPSIGHDVCLYVLGGAKFFLGKYEEAQPVLAEHLKTYPESKTRSAVAYYEASNLSRLGKVTEASKKLDAFIKDYPTAAENPFLAHALLDRANLHFKAKENLEVLKILGRVQNEFEASNIVESTYNLSGDVYKADKKRAEAKAAYLKGLELAKQRGNTKVQAASLHKLVKLLGAKKVDKKPNPNIKDAVPFYDEFWKNHPTSPFRLDIAVVGSPALIAAGREQEALDNLETAIGGEVQKERPFGVQRAIDNYTRNFVAAKIAGGMTNMQATDALKAKFIDFKGIAADDVQTRAILELQVIGRYQADLSAAKKEKNQDLVAKNNARIASAFKKLKADFPVEQLPAQGLLDLGKNLLNNSASPRQALPYFEERLKRPEKKNKIDAEFGIAEVYSLAGKGDEIRKGISMLEGIISNNAENKKLVARATAILVEIFYKQQSWDKVIATGDSYLGMARASVTKTKVTGRLGEAYLAKKDYLKAIETYVTLGSGSSDRNVAVPAQEKAFSLMWDHGKGRDGKSKEQVAYDVAAKYIKNSRTDFEENKLTMAGETRESWLRIEKKVNEWAASGRVETGTAK